jgi:hypothetical protein
MKDLVRIIKDTHGMKAGEEKKLKGSVASALVKAGFAEYIGKIATVNKGTFVPEVETTVTVTEIAPEYIGFDDLTVKEIKSLLTEKGIEIPKNAKKAELIELLK